MEQRGVLPGRLQRVGLRPLLLAGTLALAVLMTAGNASASSVGLTSFTSTEIYPNNPYNDDFDVGWSFTLNQPITILSLGYNYFGVPLDSSHEVGIWDSSGDLVASAVVDNASTALDGYLYTSLASPVTLISGTYVIGGTTLGLGDEWIYGAENIVTDPTITLDETWYYLDGTGGTLSDPTDTDPGAQYLAVNFGEDPAPEPSTLALLGLGMVGLRMLRRRKSN